jgi:hypothetical protein
MKSLSYVMDTPQITKHAKVFVGSYELEDKKMIYKRMKNEIDVPLTLPPNPLIYILEDNLEVKFCKEIVDRFENDIRKTKGRIGDNKINLNIKNTMDLQITRIAEWNDVDQKLYYVLLENLKKYEERLHKYNLALPSTLITQGFQIQKYKKGVGEYNWHTDDMTADMEMPHGGVSQMTRYITYIWYLNDVEEGGETKFLDGQVKPKAGQFLFFPATWDQIHRGEVPKSDNKYIITGWMYCFQQNHF